MLMSAKYCKGGSLRDTLLEEPKSATSKVPESLEQYARLQGATVGWLSKQRLSVLTSVHSFTSAQKHSQLRSL